MGEVEACYCCLSPTLSSLESFKNYRILKCGVFERKILGLIRGVIKFFKNLKSISKFLAPPGRHATNVTPKDRRKLDTNLKMFSLKRLSILEMCPPSD
jgi:hypothetical protein